MVFEPNLFYQVYMKDYHKIKATYLINIIRNNEKFQKELFEEEFPSIKEDDFIKTLKSDLRQTYFHSIETFFELFFALIPKENNIYDDKNIMF